MSNKKKKKKYGNKRITVVCIIMAAIMVVTMFAGIVSSIGDYTPAVSSEDYDKILAKARAKLSSMENYLLYIEGYQNKHNADLEAEPLYFAYQIAGSRSDSTHSYSYVSSNNLYDNELWYYDESSKTYIDYVYAEDVGSWVKCELDYEPVTVNPFGVLDDMDEFALLNETQTFGVNGEECYVYQMTGTSDEYEVVYERIYIGVEDFVLKGAIRMAMHSYDETIENTMDDLTLKELYSEKGVEFDEDNKASITTEQTDAEEVIFRFEYHFSNANMLFISEPGIYITAEEYARQVGMEVEE